jgi:hypothetical protein
MTKRKPCPMFAVVGTVTMVGPATIDDGDTTYQHLVIREKGGRMRHLTIVRAIADIAALIEQHAIGLFYFGNRSWERDGCATSIGPMVHDKSISRPCGRILNGRSDYGFDVLLIENAFPILSILIMSIIKCVFFYRENGEICRSVAATVAALDRRNLPVRVGGRRSFLR